MLVYQRVIPIFYGQFMVMLKTTVLKSSTFKSDVHETL